MKLSIIIPAFNEEKSIYNIIDKCKKEINNIINNSFVDKVEIVVVNDGSTDKTKEIAEQIEGIILVSHEKNSGFGAALKTGFSSSSGELIGFLDADGTCDPVYFINLLNELEKQKADITIASRMGKTSKMPKIRRLGNKIFATLINLIANTYISDSSSGFRVLKRSSMERLHPLPNGLHFVTAMSTRAVLDKNIKIVEFPIHYEERVGESKLSVIQDGIKFLFTILEIGLTYKPLKFYTVPSIILISLSFVLLYKPIIYYFSVDNIESINILTHQFLNIYRFIVIIILFLCGIIFIFTGFIAEYIKETIDNYVDHYYVNTSTRFNPPFYKIIFSSIFCIFAGIYINYDAIKQYLFFGFVDQNWIFLIVGSLLILVGIQLLSYGILLRVLILYNWRLKSK